ncbi:MMPL family transporter [Actinokineospora auranticolor]|uniref:RND superfamily putative drug exporter n=1 Tax=Actinokineospora auranticolor TaxID=155976 RepID=A0A2S6GS48_9PSEU|nr:MMPL family transporter [Actinokineospora auranticolor]PPK68072.1 RND superfamily putative drug exporter [Actinokineospora auranticolor]
MFSSWGSVVHRRRWLVLVATLVITLGGGLWGLGVFDKLTQGGYEDPASESARVNKIVEDELGQKPADIVLLYTAPAGKTVDDPEVSGKVTAALAALPTDAVASRIDYWTAGQPALASADKRLAMATIVLVGDNFDARQKSFAKVEDKLAIDGVLTQVGGKVPTERAMTERSNSDLAVAEAISLPVTLILLVLIFGSLVAAALPVLVGGLAIFGALGVLRLLSLGLEVNTFAVNVATLLGLGMAIDYGLFTVGRFREEMAAGRTPAEAVRRTVATAGRTVAFSATLLVIALAGLLVFPMDFLKSMAYGGMSAVAIAALVSLTLLPALLAILGRRVDKLSLPWRRKEPGEPKLLGRIADAVMRKPALFVAPIVAVLVVLALPFGGIEFGGSDERQLPPGDPHRATAEAITANFPAASNNTVRVVLRGANGAPDQAIVQAFTDAVFRVPGVKAFTPSGAGGNTVVFTAPLDANASSDRARHAVEGLRAIPSQAEVLVGGYPALVVDSVDGIVSRVPWMVGILAAATLVLMFLAFGSVLLPIKAVVMSALSLSATFGVLVFVFQYGHGAGLLDVTPQPIQAGMLVLIGAVVFGLSTDYETFLLARMVEARHAGMSTGDAVRTGLVRTGRMITAAALLLGVVTGAFGMSSLASMRFIGLGMIIALVLDATVVRMLLVPAVIRLFGDAAWWAPKSLRRLQEKAGLSEVESPRELEKV